MTFEITKEAHRRWMLETRGYVGRIHPEDTMAHRRCPLCGDVMHTTVDDLPALSVFGCRRWTHQCPCGFGCCTTDRLLGGLNVDVVIQPWDPQWFGGEPASSWPTVLR